MQDRPTALELIAAVQQFLSEEVLPAQSDSRLKFRTLVAANALAIVQRELGAGSALVADEVGRLQALLNPSSRAGEVPRDGLHSVERDDTEEVARALRRELAQRIRRGDADAGPWRHAVISSTMASVEAKLLISNPKCVTP